jgi:hypothetical protein
LGAASPVAPESVGLNEMTTWEPPPDKYWMKSVGASDWEMAAEWFDRNPNETERIR